MDAGTLAASRRRRVRDGGYGVARALAGPRDAFLLDGSGQVAMTEPASLRDAGPGVELPLSMCDG